jgi:hypothetical protein
LSFDNSRFTFDPWNDYAGVVMEQGRVQLDSDWNEWLAEMTRRMQAGTLDLLGHAVYPATTPYAFQITAATAGGSNTLSIGCGRMYVDGLLAENHGLAANAQWDPALAELSGSPQPPPTSSANPIDFATQQPYSPGATIPAGNGPFLAYLDVWTRPITFLEDPRLIDPAIGIDTTGRLQTVWQVKLMPVPAGSSWNCSTLDSSIPWPVSSGQLSIGTVATAPSGPCCLTTGNGYSGAENQFYRVEIHRPGGSNALGASGGASFKWSRDNASVETGVTAIANATNSLGTAASQLKVLSLGRDQVLGFVPGNWIEVLNDTLYLNGQPGELCQIDSIDVSGKTITLAAPLTNASFPPGTPATASNTRIRRWDQSGKIYEADGKTLWYDLGASGVGGDIPVPAAGTTLLLESGITVSFGLSSATGGFLTGDFWTFAARSADGSLYPTLAKAAPRGIHHHYAKLALVSFGPASASDCRSKWPPAGASGECGCCSTATVGDGVESFGQFTSIQQAINSLPPKGGEVSILPGRYFENVYLAQRQDIVIHGCGWQTRVASAALAPAGSGASGSTASGAANPTANPPGSVANNVSAVFTLTGCAHIVLRSFAIEAASGEAGILVDGSGGIAAPAASSSPAPAGSLPINQGAKYFSPAVIDTALEDLVLTASTLPAILASSVQLLKIADNRIAMKDLPSLWPAVYVSGKEIHIERNWIGVQGTAADTEWLPTSVDNDLNPVTKQIASSEAAASGAATNSSSSSINAEVNANISSAATPVANTPGGIQIAGPSRDVFVIENEIEGGKRNGITLGNLLHLDASGADTHATYGVLMDTEDACSTTSSLVPPAVKVGKLAAGPKLIDILIARNRIRNMGLCGIGPVGFFNLVELLEVISIERLSIVANTISNTLLSPLTSLDSAASSFGYGAICVPDVQTLILRDNTITNFGVQPGAEVCGIFILHGEFVEISRNHVLETRDWALAKSEELKSPNGMRAGILVMLVTPPTLDAASSSLWTSSASGASTPSEQQSEISTNSISSVSSVSSISSISSVSSLAAPIYQPTLPALRVEHNVVRVPLGEALEVVGFGPFSIVNNQLSSGGTVLLAGTALAGTALAGTALALTVVVLNLGVAIELAEAASSYSALYQATPGSSLSVGSNALANSGSGAVLFSNNLCQLEANASRQRGFASVLLLSLDQLLFANNQCWIDGPERTTTADALLLAASLQVLGNRFQEGRAAVVYSAITLGLVNITTQNISTYCLLSKALANLLIKSPNLVLDASLCSASLTLLQ